MITKKKWVDDWISNVLIPWEKGDILQIWVDCENRWATSAHSEELKERSDLLGMRPDIQQRYRIKPRTVKWVFEMPENANNFEPAANQLERMGLGNFAMALRNAKPMPE